MLVCVVKIQSGGNGRRVNVIPEQVQYGGFRVSKLI
jgi:hypothetical protein